MRLLPFFISSDLYEFYVSLLFFGKGTIKLNKNLQEMAIETTASSQLEIDKLRVEYIAEMEQLQKKLLMLENERDELLEKLKGSSVHK